MIREMTMDEALEVMGGRHTATDGGGGGDVIQSPATSLAIPNFGVQAGKGVETSGNFSIGLGLGAGCGVTATFDQSLNNSSTAFSVSGSCTLGVFTVGGSFTATPNPPSWASLGR